VRLRLTIGLLGILCALAFDYAMDKDAERLCSNDADAYAGCQDR
jgi:hypothetical protein